MNMSAHTLVSRVPVDRDTLVGAAVLAAHSAPHHESVNI